MNIKSFLAISSASLMLLAWAGEIENPVLLIHGASHVDLYDDVAGVIPYDKIESFFKTNLK